METITCKETNEQTAWGLHWIWCLCYVFVDISAFVLVVSQALVPRREAGRRRTTSFCFLSNRGRAERGERCPNQWVPDMMEINGWIYSTTPCTSHVELLHFLLDFIPTRFSHLSAAFLCIRLNFRELLPYVYSHSQFPVFDNWCVCIVDLMQFGAKWKKKWLQSVTPCIYSNRSHFYGIYWADETE